MLLSIEQVLTEVQISRYELDNWIERRWVRPVEREGTFLFDEADRARVKLISELRLDLEVEEDVMPMILGLLDQIYTLRRALSELQGAIQELPPEMRKTLEARLKGD